MHSTLKNSYAIILAAGASLRFGSPKQLANWREHNLLQHSINILKSIFDKNIIVVLGANHKLIQSSLNENDITVILNKDWQTGMSSSIQMGIKTLPANADAAMILLCDQPLLKESSLKSLVNLWQQHKSFIVASAYKNIIGVPAIFPASFFLQLESLTGDNGAKQLLSSYKEQVLTVSIPEAAMDIDTQDDFNQLKMQSNT